MSFLIRNSNTEVIGHKVHLGIWEEKEKEPIGLVSLTAQRLHPYCNKHPLCPVHFAQAGVHGDLNVCPVM